MKGKYQTRAAFWSARFRRGILRVLLRRLAGWDALAAPEDGYSIIIGCRTDMLGVLRANLFCLQRQEMPNLRRVILVFDQPRDVLPADFEQKLTSCTPHLPLLCLYYTKFQCTTVRILSWGWANAWLSWVLGIAAVRTRYAVLHDLDALLLEPGFIEARYHRIRAEALHYLGVRYYEGNGVAPSDGLVTTFEMFFDVPYVRESFKPIDIFNHVCRYRDRTVDFDTFLYAQSGGDSRAIMPGGLEEMVHPSQMICQYVMLLGGSNRLPGATNNLLLVPYYAYLGGESELLKDLTVQMTRCESGRVSLWGRPYHVAALSGVHIEWLRKQAFRVETALYARVRTDVSNYFDALVHAAAPQTVSLPCLSDSSKRV